MRGDERGGRIAAAESAVTRETPTPQYTFNTHYRLYLRDREEFRLWMNPLLYLRQGTGEVSSHALTESDRRRILLSLFQERLRKLLYVFLHGHGLPELARVLMVLGDRSADRVVAELRALDFLATELRVFPDVELGDSRRVLRDLLRRSQFRGAELARGLTVFYRQMEPEFRRLGEGGATHQVKGIASFREEDCLGHDAAYFRPLVELARYLGRETSDLLRGAFLFGSLATMDYVKGFSDTEVLLIVRGETMKDAAALLRLRRAVVRSVPYLYRMHPFQHHGHFVMTEADMDCYPQSLFPVVLFPYSRDLLGRGEDLVFRERDSGLERRRAAWDLCYLSRRRYLERSRPRNFYEWKAHLDTVLLIPQAYLAARGIYCHKRESFARAGPDFSPESWEIIERATALRESWSLSPRMGFLARDVLPDTLRISFWPWFAGHCSGAPRNANGTSGSRGLKRSFAFAEAVLEKLREGGVL